MSKYTIDYSFTNPSPAVGKGQTESVDAAFQKARALHRAGKAPQAAALYQQVINARPSHFEALTLFAMLNFQCDRCEDALQLLDRAIKVNPASAMVWVNRGNVLSAMQRYEDALASHDHALTLQPDFAEAYFNRGTVLQEMGRLEESVESYDRALAVKPNYVEALYNRGNALGKSRRYSDALATWMEAQKIRPDYALAHYNEALVRLLLGDYERGWEKYEWRWKAMSTQRPRPFSQPLWLGRKEIAGKTILLHAEQGLGDTIQFCRYAKHVADLGAKVLMEVQPALVGLIATLEGPVRVVSRGEALPEFDFHTPLLSLPLATKHLLGTTIPADIPYLKVPPEKMGRWQHEVGECEGLRVGLVWSGSQRNIKGKHRSMQLADFAPLLEIQQATFVSLQKELRDEDQSALAQFPQIIHYGERLQDFADTAAVIATLDLVITIDTAVAHLVGALGKPVWVVLPHTPDWRWLLEVSDSPWYPTAKLYRQSGWDSAVRGVTEDLRKLI